jgi:small subunit ribosomal protein S6
MTRTYECMFLIDNDVVRAGWSSAKSSVAGIIEKNGGTVVTSRRWDERRLAYPIKHRRRATYLLAFCDLEPTAMDTLRRDLDISESILRYLMTSAEAVPDPERELSRAEEADDFVLPVPPADDEPEPAAAPAEAPQRAATTEPDSAEGGESAEEDESAEETPAEPAGGSSEDAEPQVAVTSKTAKSDRPVGASEEA